MLTLKEIANSEELSAIKQEFSGSPDFMEDYLQIHGKKGVGFVDPLLSSPRQPEIYETLRRTSLKEILGAGTGSDFMSYLIPTKVYQVLFDAFREADIMDQIAGLVIRDFEGGTVNVNWGLLGKIKPRWGAAPGGAAIETEEANRAVITPKEFSMDMAITRTMIEDSVHDLIQYHIAAGGKEMANFAVARALETMFAGRDTAANSESGATDAIAVLDVVNACGMVAAQGGAPDICVLTRAQVYDLIGDTTTFNLALDWKEAAAGGQITSRLMGLTYLPRVVSTTNGLYDTSTTDYYALVFEKARALAVAWKRPITIENYTSPREGLVGAFCSARVGFGIMNDGDFIASILEVD